MVFSRTRGPMQRVYWVHFGSKCARELGALNASLRPQSLRRRGSLPGCLLCSCKGRNLSACPSGWNRPKVSWCPCAFITFYHALQFSYRRNQLKSTISFVDCTSRGWRLAIFPLHLQISRTLLSWAFIFARISLDRNSTLPLHYAFWYKMVHWWSGWNTQHVNMFKAETPKQTNCWFSDVNWRVTLPGSCPLALHMAELYPQCPKLLKSDEFKACCNSLTNPICWRLTPTIFDINNAKNQYVYMWITSHHGPHAKSVHMYRKCKICKINMLHISYSDKQSHMACFIHLWDCQRWGEKSKWPQVLQNCRATDSFNGKVTSKKQEALQKNLSNCGWGCIPVPLICVHLKSCRIYQNPSPQHKNWKTLHPGSGTQTSDWT